MPMGDKVSSLKDYQETCRLTAKKFDMSEIALDARFAALARGKDEQFLSMLKNHMLMNWLVARHLL